VTSDVVGDSDLRRARAADDAAGIEGGDDDIEGVVERAFELVDNVVGAAADKEADVGCVSTFDKRECVFAVAFDVQGGGGTEI